MRARSPHHSDVFSHLPVSLMRALEVPAVAQVLDLLVAAGWRTGQLRHRVGAEPAQGSPDRDAAHLLEFLRGLLDQEAPDVAHARALRERERARATASEAAPPPASPQVRAAAIEQIRSGLKGAPAKRPEPAPRTRPACSLCAGEGAFFVTAEVHLCRRCVEVMATGEARLSQAG